MLKRFLILTFMWSLHLTARGQYDCSFEHYSSKHGLSQYTVSVIYQDSKDIMWFGTFDGLNKFDGYRFKVYKPLSDRIETISDNRIDNILEDCYGILWIRTRSGDILRFDTDRERFFPVRSPNHGMLAQITNIQQMPSGNIWLYTANEGCYLAEPTPDPETVRLTHWSVRNGILPSNEVREVMDSPDKKEWIVTAGGIVIVNKANEVEETIGQESVDNYLCAFVIGKEIWCGMLAGKVRIFDSATGSFREVDFPVTSSVVGISQLHHNKVLLLSGREGFIIYDAVTGKADVHNKRRHPAMPSDRMIRATTDSFGEIWIETEALGMLHFDPEREELRYFLPEVDQAGIYRYSAWSHIIEDVNGYMWIYPKGGGFSFYDRENRELKYFYNKPGDPGQRFSNVVFQVYSDRQGNLWMNTYSRGIEKISFTHSPMQYLRPNPSSEALPENEVRALAQISDGTIWCATRDGSLYLYDSEYRQIGPLGADGRLNSRPLFNSFVYDIIEDRQGRIWLGTRGNGVFLFTRKGVNRYDITNYVHSPVNALSVSSNNIYAIYEDGQGRIWLGTWGSGLNYFESGPEGDTFINYRNYLTGYPAAEFTNIRCVTGDREGVLWIGTTEGVVSLTHLSGNNYHATTYRHQAEDPHSLSANDVHDILVCGDTLWIATFGGGLNRMIRDDTGQAYFTAFNTQNGFPADIILSIQQDRNGQLWMDSESEIIRLDPLTGQAEIFTTYTPEITFDINFSEGASLADHKGNLVFGHSGGAFRFNPSTISKSSFVPRIMFSQMLLFNREVNPSDVHSPLDRNIDHTEAIRLKHNQSVFSLEYAALDYNNSQAIEYAYMLDGFDKEWNYAGNQRMATYTNLPYGTYTFKVRSTNADKIWVDNTRTLQIEMLPPFWLTTWAYVLYALITMLLLYSGFRILFSFYRLRNEVEMEHRMTEMKLRFFTDISHEIRTPLTLISTPIEHLLENGELNESARGTLNLMKVNTDRLLRLVNQLLDFRKIQNRKMKMHIEQVALASFTASVCYSFIRETEERNIRFTFIDDSEGSKIWVDKDKLEKILFNILSNAFKFTPDGRAISCTVNNDVNEMFITIEDEGPGIAPEILENLFVRFESASGKPRSAMKGTSRVKLSSRTYQAGTGIGLSLTKELMDLHFGQIDMENNPDIGAKVTLRFQKGRSHYSDLTGYTIFEPDGEKDGKGGGQPDTDGQGNSLHADTAKPGRDEAETIMWEDGSENRATILFIEDNKELRHFLIEITAQQYCILEADNGETGLELARSEQPDMIVSDIMMEGMDGLEMMRRLRMDISTSHIPVIMLTARSGLEERVRAMELGADDFIVKPFSSTYLLARISNLLEQRVKLQQFYASSAGLSTLPSKGENLPQMQPSSVDAGFMKKLVNYMNEHIADPDLRIEELLSHFCVSRSLFFKKVKSLTGLSPVEYIREFRVQRATELICNPDLSIKEITYLVGMNDSRYFARCFKQKHGMSPSDYRIHIQSSENPKETN